MGRLIPAGTGLAYHKNRKRQRQLTFDSALSFAGAAESEAEGDAATE